MTIFLELIVLVIIFASIYIIPWVLLNYYALKHGINFNLLLSKYDLGDRFFNILEASKSYILVVFCVDFLVGFVSLGSTMKLDEILFGLIFLTEILTVLYIAYIIDVDSLEQEIIQAIACINERQPIKL